MGMIETNRKPFRSEQDAVYGAAQFLNETLGSYGDVPVLLLVSGGSALKILSYVYLTRCGHMTIGLVDERISDNVKDRNMTALEATGFFRLVKHAHPVFLSVKQEVTLPRSARQYEEDLRSWRKNHLDGKIVVIAGIGPDGHTAGIMPFPNDPEQFRKLFEGREWVVGYDAGEKSQFPHRVTLTNTFLRQADAVVVFACGREKKEAIERTLESEGNLHQTPARIVREMKHVGLYTNIPLPRQQI